MLKVLWSTIQLTYGLLSSGLIEVHKNYLELCWPFFEFVIAVIALWFCVSPRYWYTVYMIMACDCYIITMQEVELNQTSTDKKPNAGNVSPASLANGNKQSNGYDSPRIGRRFEAVLNCSYVLETKKTRQAWCITATIFPARLCYSIWNCILGVYIAFAVQYNTIQAFHWLWGSAGLKMPIHANFFGVQFGPTK